MIKNCQQHVGQLSGPHSTVEATHRIRGYWGGAAKKTMGKDLMLCEAHAKTYANFHPFNLPPERLETK